MHCALVLTPRAAFWLLSIRTTGRAICPARSFRSSFSTVRWPADFSRSSSTDHARSFQVTRLRSNGSSCNPPSTGIGPWPRHSVSQTKAARRPMIGKSCGRTIRRRSTSVCCWQLGQYTRSQGRRARNAASIVGLICGRLRSASSAFHRSTMASACLSRAKETNASRVSSFYLLFAPAVVTHFGRLADERDCSRKTEPYVVKYYGYIPGVCGRFTRN